MLAVRLLAVCLATLQIHCISGGDDHYSFLAGIAQQGQALAHNLQIASRMKNLGGYLGGHNRIAFSAITSSSSSYSGSSDVKFSTIITNVGNGFSHSTGIFTAPHAGVYVFEWSIRSYSGNNEYPGIYVNGKLMMVTHCYGYSSYYNSCSKTITLKLQKQDGVSIRSYSGTMYVAGTYSSFSGWML